jgi:hypothetical protein
MLIQVHKLEDGDIIKLIPRIVDFYPNKSA